MATAFRAILTLGALLLFGSDGVAGGGGSVNVPPDSVAYGQPTLPPYRPKRSALNELARLNHDLVRSFYYPLGCPSYVQQQNKLAIA
jgi:hypothetical protein